MENKEKMEDKSKAKANKTTATKKAPAKSAPAKIEIVKAETKTINKKIQRTVTGKVVSNKMDKTITVLVERKVKHPLYGKFINLSNKFHAHDEKNEINEGDIVQITEHKPLSKSKSWVLTKVLSKGQG